MSRHPERLILMVVLILMALYAYPNDAPNLPALASEGSSSEQQSTGPLIVTCSPDRPIAFPRETVRLTAWASSPNEPIQYEWEVSAGRLEGQGSEISWDFTGVRPGKIYEAKVRVSDASGRSAEGSVQVILQSRPVETMGGGRETGRSFLLPDQQEDPGYGLYSYLLLGAEPSDAARPRYLKAVLEYLKFPDINDLEKYIKRNELNITYMPIRELPGKDTLKQIKDKQYDKVVEWVLAHYDYARALLRKLPRDHRDGPYILSFLQPYDWKAKPSRPYGIQNLSFVMLDLVEPWMKLFLNQAAQERFWKAKTGEKLVLQLRNVVEIMAKDLPEIKRSLKDWIAWVS